MHYLKSFRAILLLLLSISLFLQAHEGHEHLSSFAADSSFGSQMDISLRFISWLHGIGRFHFLFLHFPIALIVMTAVAELLWLWFKNPLFAHAARFMILSAALFALPTAFLGFAFSYGQHYEGLPLDLFLWHRYFGCFTTGLALIAAILRERYVRQQAASLISYYVCLFFLFISVSLTGAFGGSLTFGLDVW